MGVFKGAKGDKLVLFIVLLWFGVSPSNWANGFFIPSKEASVRLLPAKPNPFQERLRQRRVLLSSSPSPQSWRRWIFLNRVLDLLPTLPFNRKPVQHLLRICLAFAAVVPTACLISAFPAHATNIATTVSPPTQSINEVQLGLRLVFAAVVGGAVGQERSSSDQHYLQQSSDTNRQQYHHYHAAGLRTLALVSLGAAAFTICSAYGFSNTTYNSSNGGTVMLRYDPSRMAANVASGVGFIGAGVITTTQKRQSSTEDSSSPLSMVHGLTTATAIWLAASIGVLSGTGCYFLASITTLLTIVILRFGRFQQRLKRYIVKHSVDDDRWHSYVNRTDTLTVDTSQNGFEAPDHRHHNRTTSMEEEHP